MGLSYLMKKKILREADKETLLVSSSAFSYNGWIPPKYTCDGENINPPLDIKNLPKGTRSMALIVEDPDAPIGIWDHWVVWNIFPGRRIKENTIPGTEGINSFQTRNYLGPCPPSGIHRYFFRVFALNIVLDIDPGSSTFMVKKKIAGHVLASGETVGLYRKG